MNFTTTSNSSSNRLGMNLWSKSTKGIDNYAFINLLAPTAISLSKRKCVRTSTFIALAAVYSNWGKNCPGFNLFGIESNSLWNGLTYTRFFEEIVDNKKATEHKTYKAYRNWDESLEDMANIIASTDFKLDLIVAKQVAKIVNEYNLIRFD